MHDVLIMIIHYIFVLACVKGIKYDIRNVDNIHTFIMLGYVALLNNIGNLSKLYLENDSKDSWQCEWIKISVYQMTIKGKQSKKKAKKNKPILKYQYEVKMRKWVNKNTPRYAYLNRVKLE